MKGVGTKYFCEQLLVGCGRTAEGTFFFPAVLAFAHSTVAVCNETAFRNE